MRYFIYIFIFLLSTKDAYSNDVDFKINNLIINNQIIDSFFKIPNEKDL